MDHYHIFRHHLAVKFPAYGYALWEPGPGNLSPAAVEVGDVGYICQGKFRRLFNVFLPADHPSHHNFGVPDYHEQLTLNMENHIETSRLSPHNFCSAGVNSGPESDLWANGPQIEGDVSFSCPMKEGAVLCLPIQAKGEDTVASADFGKWIIRHIDCWFAWARHLGLGIDRMEDIILVTGTHRTRSWTNVAFPGGQRDAQASFGAKVDRRGENVAINWQFSHNRGAVLNFGPDGEDLPEDQCIFVRGFRVTRKLKILPPRLRAAAGPSPEPEEYDEEPDAELIPIPTAPEYRDPLHLLLEYIADESPPNCDMLLVHDDDLAQLHGIYDSAALDALQSEVVLGHIRSLKPTVHNVRIDLSSTGNGASADTPSAWVATLSNIFTSRSPPLTTSPPPRNPQVKELRITSPQSPQRMSRYHFASSSCDLYARPPFPAPFPEPNAPRIVGAPIGVPDSLTAHSFTRERPHRRLPLVPSHVPPRYHISGHTAAIPQLLEHVSPYHGTGHVNYPSFTTLHLLTEWAPNVTKRRLNGYVVNQDILEPRYFLPAPSYRTVPFVRSHVSEGPRLQTNVPGTDSIPPLPQGTVTQPPDRHLRPSRYRVSDWPKRDYLSEITRVTLEPTWGQMWTEHVNDHTRPPDVYPHTHPLDYTRPAPSQPDGFATRLAARCRLLRACITAGSGHPPNPLPSRDPSYGGGQSDELVFPHASDWPQQYIRTQSATPTPCEWMGNRIDTFKTHWQQKDHNEVSYGHQAHAPAATRPFFLRSIGQKKFGRKKALLIGIDYSSHPDARFRRKSGVRDAQEIVEPLLRHSRFEENNIQILTDDQPENIPTRDNILEAMHWLVEGAQPHDTLLFYFSGHAARLKGTHENEPNRLHEGMCAMDYMDTSHLSSPTTPGVIVDDDMYNIMVKYLPSGCRLTAVLDCCYDGTLIDLPFVYDSLGVLKPCDPNVVDRRSSNADVICLSTCENSGGAFNPEGGALRRPFVEYISSWGDRGTYLDMMQSLHAYMTANGFGKRPQLSSSHLIDLNQPFRITNGPPHVFAEASLSGSLYEENLTVDGLLLEDY